MLEIEEVIAGSVADLAGLRAGDQLLTLDQRVIEDIVDYFLAIDQQSVLELEVLRDKELFQCRLELEEGETPGLIPVHPEPLHCGNNCVFCFVHQLPRGMRRTLYVKDEDYRFSWLYGSYITLANLGDAELQRILVDRLSPLYISVHATDEEVRSRLLGKRLPPILPLLERLIEGGIRLHTQIVVCPGYNDGAILDQTMRDLARLHSGILSLAVVPVGLTRHRDRLPRLDPLTAEAAALVLDQVDAMQQVCLDEWGGRFVFAADELYLRARCELPPLEGYEELWQLENGVGMIPLFRAEAEEVLLESTPLDLRKVSLITGSSFAMELEGFARRLGVRTGTELQVVSVENRFFGSSVSVAGLLTGRDILAATEGRDLGEAVLVPDVLFKADEELLLDDMSLAELEAGVGVPVLRISSDPWGILDGLERLDCRDIEILEG